jgi:hypothetical protein
MATTLPAIPTTLPVQGQKWSPSDWNGWSPSNGITGRLRSGMGGRLGPEYARTAPELLDDISCDSPERRRRKIAAYTRPHLLCIDEVGYLSYDDHAADLLYKVINPRYEKRRSLIVSTNLAFKDWNTVFPNATCIVTLIDRLIHHADVTRIEGESYRHHESEAEAAARRQRLP